MIGGGGGRKLIQATVPKPARPTVMTKNKRIRSSMRLALDEHQESGGTDRRRVGQRGAAADAPTLDGKNAPDQ